MQRVRAWWAIPVVLFAACDRRSPSPTRPAEPRSAKAQPSEGLPSPKSDVITNGAPTETLRKAPELRVSGWIGGKNPLTEGRPRLVVGWATWCPGCVSETPYLTALSKKYAGKIDVMALTDESVETVESETKKMDLRVAPRFPIAADESRDGTLAAYSEGHVMLPNSWLVARGRIVWSGGPDDSVAALEEVLRTGDAAGARASSDELPALAKSYRNAFARAGAVGSKKEATALLDACRGRAGFANSVAWALLDRDETSDVAFATELARVANDASLDSVFAHLDTYALGLWRSGKRKEALGVEEKAIALCGGLHASCAEERSRLEEFRQQGKP